MSRRINSAVSKAVQLLKEEYPHMEKVLFGSGASEQNGVKEGDYNIRFLLYEWKRLSEFEAFRKYPKYEMERLKDRIAGIAESETKSHNTFSELEYGLPRLIGLGCQRIVLLTEPTHISRALAHGFEVLAKLGGHNASVSLIGEHSDVNPSKVQPHEVVVFEPRGDGQNSIVPNLRRIFKVPAEKRALFNDKFSQALTDVGA